MTSRNVTDRRADGRTDVQTDRDGGIGREGESGRERERDRERGESERERTRVIILVAEMCEQQIT